jgi:3-methyladenine DNA glycosylase AlkD
MSNTEKQIDLAQLMAESFLAKLFLLRTEKVNNAQFFRDDDGSNKFVNVRMSDIFALAKECKQMPLEEIEKLLESDYYEARLGAVSIMDFQARDKKITDSQRKILYELYLNRHDRINNWDLVDRSSPFVIGGYLFDKPRTPLYQLARSKNVCERRTAIVSTYYFIRQNEVDETFKIAEILVHDEHDLINKAVGGWIREAGKRDAQKLFDFLNKYAATMPRVTLRYAVEKLESKLKDFYLKMKK